MNYSAGTQTYTDSTVQPGQMYYYRIAALENGQPVLYSNTYSVLIPQ